MNHRDRVDRVRASILAAAVGWMAAMIVTLPLALFKVWTSASDGGRPLLWSLAAGTGIWCLWTLTIVAGAWLLGALPAIVIVREAWLLRHRGWAIVISAALAEAVVLVKFQFWMFLVPEYYTEPRLLTLYSLLLVVFASAASAAYLRLIVPLRATLLSGSSPR